jgi:hypothetical protein
MVPLATGYGTAGFGSWRAMWSAAARTGQITAENSIVLRLVSAALMIALASADCNAWGTPQHSPRSREVCNLKWSDVDVDLGRRLIVMRTRCLASWDPLKPQELQLSLLHVVLLQLAWEAICLV